MLQKTSTKSNFPIFFYWCRCDGIDSYRSWNFNCSCVTSFSVVLSLLICVNSQEEADEHDEEMDEDNDYGNSYFDNGDAYNDEDDNLDDGPVY